MERKKSASFDWFKCKFCQRVFRTRLELRLHKKREHLKQCIEEKRQISGAVSAAADKKFASQNSEGEGKMAIVGSDEYEWKNAGEETDSVTGAEQDGIEHAGRLSSSLEPGVSCAIKQEKFPFEESVGSVEPEGYSLRPDVGSSSKQLWSHHAAAELNYKELKTEGYEVQSHSGTVPATVSASEEIIATEYEPFSSPLDHQEVGVLPKYENQDDYCLLSASELGTVKLRDLRAQLVSKYRQKSECVHPMNPWSLLEQFKMRQSTEQRLRTHQCPHCPVAFISIATYHRHMREVHSEQFYTDTTNPEQPQCQTKNGVDPAGCTRNTASEPQSAVLLSDQSAAQSAQLSNTTGLPSLRPTDQLISSASNQNYSCITCNQSFRRFESLKSHMRLKHPPNEEPQITQPDVLECDNGAAGANTQTLNEERITEGFNDGCMLESPCKIATVRVAPTRIAPKDSAMGSIKSSGYSKIDRILDNKLHRSLLRSRLGYKCCKCVRYFSSRVALIRHYCEDHPTLFASAGPRITNVTSLANSSQPSNMTEIESAERSRVLPRRRVKKGINKDHCQEINGKQFSKCSYCSKIVLLTSLERHERIHTGEKPYKCSLCPMTFSRTDVLKTHQNSFHDIVTVRVPLSKGFSCTMCDYVTSVKKHLRQHVKRCHNVNLAVCGPERASVSLSSRAAREGGQETQESTGNSSSSTPINGASGVEEVPSQPPKAGGRPKCPYCCKDFSGTSNLRAHMRVHTGKKPYTCSFCTERFMWKSQLRMHQQTFHVVGGKSTANPIYLDCPKDSKSKSYNAVEDKNCHRYREAVHKSPTRKLATLQSAASAKPAPASQNHASASVKSAPATQKLEHVLAKPAPGTQKFVLRSSQPQLEPVPCTLVAQTLTPVQPEVSRSSSKSKLQCQQCSISCATLTALQDHESIHTGQKLHSCSKCPKVFSSRGNAIRHEKNVHRRRKRRPTSRPTKTSPEIGDTARTEPVSSTKEEEPSESPDVVNIDSDSWDTETVHLDPTKDLYTCMLCDDGQEYVSSFESVKSHVVREHKLSLEKALKFVHLQSTVEKHSEERTVSDVVSNL